MTLPKTIELELNTKGIILVEFQQGGCHLTIKGSISDSHIVQALANILIDANIDIMTFVLSYSSLQARKQAGSDPVLANPN